MRAIKPAALLAHVIKICCTVVVSAVFVVGCADSTLSPINQFADDYNCYDQPQGCIGLGGQKHGALAAQVAPSRDSAPTPTRPGSDHVDATISTELLEVLSQTSAEQATESAANNTSEDQVVDFIEVADADLMANQHLLESQRYIEDLQQNAHFSKFDLEQLIAVANKLHPSIQAKQSALYVAESQISSAQQNYYPTPNVSYNRSENVNVGILSLTQPLWSGGRLDATLSVAKASAQAAIAELDSARYEMAASIINIYQAWLQAHQRVAVRQREIKRIDALKKTISRRVATGASASIDIAQADARLYQARSDLSAHKAAEKSALARLSQRLGTPLNVDMLVVPDETLVANIAPVNVLLRQAMKNYPQLRKLLAEIEAARNQVTAQKATLLPTINLKAEKAFGSNSSEYFDGDRSHQVYLSLDYTPGAGFSTVHNIASSEAKVSALIANRKSLVRELVEQVHSDFAEYITAKGQISGLKKTFKANLRLLNSYKRLFASGQRRWIDVVNAVRDLTQVELALGDSTALIIGSAFKLRLLSGAFDHLLDIEKPTAEAIAPAH